MHAFHRNFFTGDSIGLEPRRFFMKTQNNVHEKTRRLVLLAFLAALVVVLQLLTEFVMQPYQLPISLVLLPVVVGAILLGTGEGAFLGGVFGVVVSICSLTGVDKAGAAFCMVNPFMTVLLCVCKGVLAGLLAGLVYKLVFRSSKNVGVSSVFAAAAAPIANTGVFLLGATTFFSDTVHQWASDAEVANFITYVFVGLIGINFVIEFFINVIITPIIMPAISKNFGSKENISK